VRRDYYAKTHPGTGDFKLNPDGMMDYRSLILPDRIPGVLKNAAASVDLTGMVGGDRFKGQITCTMLEPMMYGCVSVVHESMLTKERSILYGRDDIVWPVKNDRTIAKDINKLMRKPKLRKKIAKRAYKYAKRYHDSKRVVERIFVPFHRYVTSGVGSNVSTFFDNYQEYMEGATL
jgi:hypothetical protein